MCVCSFLIGNKPTVDRYYYYLVNRSTMGLFSMKEEMDEHKEVYLDPSRKSFPGCSVTKRTIYEIDAGDQVYWQSAYDFKKQHNIELSQVKVLTSAKRDFPHDDSTTGILRLREDVPATLTRHIREQIFVDEVLSNREEFRYKRPGRMG